jgi:protocatechuate 3,4-dioxygenase beta subunit
MLTVGPDRHTSCRLPQRKNEAKKPMKRTPTLLLCLLLITPAFRAQDASPVSAPLSADSQSEKPARAELQGLVTKDPTGEPVKKVLIELIAENQNAGGNYTAITNADGTFHIEGIVPGRYRLFAERTGYLETDKHRPRADGRVLTLNAGQELKDVLIRLQAAAVVEGRVTDEDGEALPNAQVAVLRETFVSGHHRWEQAAAERTNDLGEYRVPGLAPGSYYISVTPPPDLRSWIETASKVSPPDAGREAAAPDKPRPTSYVTTYYPGVKDRSQASTIQLRAGDDFPANFSLTRSPSLAIRGSIANLPPDASALVMIQSKDFGLVQTGGEIRKDGSFEIPNVSPGSYTLVATVSGPSEPMTARQTVQVAAANLEGLKLLPQSGGWIHGRLRLESRGSMRGLNPGQIFLSLCSADGDDNVIGASSLDGFTNVAQVAADGSFEWKNVPPGHYYVQPSGDPSAPADWFLKSVVAGNRDARDAGFTVSGGTTALELLASANSAIVEGIATNHQGEPVANAVVVLAPETRLRSHVDRYRKTASDQNGRFTVRGIPPGAYTLIAWESVEGDAYYDSEFLKNYEGQGKPLRLGEGEHSTQQLEAIPEAEGRP